MNVQSDDVRNRWVDGPSYRGDNTFTQLFTQDTLDKEGLNQWSGAFTK